MPRDSEYRLTILGEPGIYGCCRRDDGRKRRGSALEVGLDCGVEGDSLVEGFGGGIKVLDIES